MPNMAMQSPAQQKDITPGSNGNSHSQADMVNKLHKDQAHNKVATQTEDSSPDWTARIFQGIEGGDKGPDSAKSWQAKGVPDQGDSSGLD
jgi:hypothetical protein